MIEREEHSKLADELEDDADTLARASAELGERIAGARDDWERTRQTSGIAGGTPDWDDPDEDDEDGDEGHDDHDEDDDDHD